jgi:hypothetical protein
MFQSNRFSNAPLRSFLAHVTATLIMGGLLVLGGCDSGGAMEEDPSTTEKTTTLSGTITADGGSSNLRTKDARLNSSVGGATVTAVRLNDDGSQTALDDTTESNSDGSFKLEVKQQSEGATVVVKAVKSETNFSSSVGVQVTDKASTTAQPMTDETAAEAQVATSLNEKAGDAENATEALADAATLVDNDVASAILSGDTAPENVADLARSMEETREDYANDAGASVTESDVANEEQDAYETLQQALANASSNAERAEAQEAFDAAMASSYEDAGASTDTQAEIQQAGTKVALNAVDASSLPDAAARGLERRATVLRAIATGESVESTIDSEGAGSGVGDEMKADRSALLDSVRTAASRADIDEARTAYRDSAKANLEEAFNMGPTDVQKGFDNLQTALDNLNGALSDAISATDNVDAGAVSDAFQTYYENGVQTVQQVYSDRGAQSGPANSAAKVTSKVGAF